MHRKGMLLLGSMIALVGMLALAPGFGVIHAANAGGETPNNSGQVRPQQVDPESAKAYAQAVGVNLKEATARLELQPSIGNLEAALGEKIPDIYGGLTVEHGADLRIVVRLTILDTGRALALVADPRLKPLISFLQVPSTLAQLESARADGAAKAAAAGVRANSGISIKDNMAELYVADSAQLNAGLAATGGHLPTSLRVVEGVVTHEASDIYGGLYTNDCTTGFSVRNPYTGVEGFTVAGHCANTQVRDGYSFAFMGGTGGGDLDI